MNSNDTQAALPIKKKVLLLVEDDSFLVTSYKMILERENFSVLAAHDGQEALDLINSIEPPVLVLLDLMLPRISGYDVLAEIRKSPTWKNVPVIIMTNLGQSEDIEQSKTIGVQGYLPKSQTRMAEVVLKIKELLGESTAKS